MKMTIIIILVWLTGSAVCYYFTRSKWMQEHKRHNEILWSGEDRANAIILSLITSWPGAIYNAIGALSGYDGKAKW